VFIIQTAAIYILLATAKPALPV